MNKLYLSRHVHSSLCLIVEDIRDVRDNVVFLTIFEGLPLSPSPDDFLALEITFCFFLEVRLPTRTFKILTVGRDDLGNGDLAFSWTYHQLALTNLYVLLMHYIAHPELCKMGEVFFRVLWAHIIENTLTKYLFLAESIVKIIYPLILNTKRISFQQWWQHVRQIFFYKAVHYLQNLNHKTLNSKYEGWMKLVKNTKIF